MVVLGKYLVSLAAAVAVSVALFLFMQRLVNQPSPEFPDLQISGFVEIFRPVAEHEEPVEPPPPEPAQTEPQLEQAALSFASPQDKLLELDSDFAIPSSDLALSFGAVEGGVAVDVAQELLGEFGQDTREGVIEITPFATRRPNIPHIAWENKLNGWVLVVFNVAPNGQTRNIKVLDAHPKGIFEQEVVRALTHWHYDLSQFNTGGKDLVLTQKIQLDWQNYPNNMPYYD